MTKLTRLRAYAIHLCISVAIFLVFLSVMFWVWYPSPYFEVDGGWAVLKILVGVDVVLGPTLTLIVFKPGKPGLKFDMTCIAIAQLAALIYGGTIIYQQRPLYTVFAVDRFISVTAAEVDPTKLQHKELKRTGGIGPLLVNARLPDTPQGRQELLFSVVLNGGKDIELRPELYEPYKPDTQQLQRHSIKLASITALSADAKRAVDAFIAKQGGRLEDYLYLPLQGKNKDIVMVISSQDGKPIGSINIDPWIGDYQKPAADPT